MTDQVLPPSIINFSSDVEQARVAQEIQTAILTAKKFPRDTNAAYSRVIQACKRIGLAEEAFYAYKRGTSMVEGDTIRLAECVAQNWGNLKFGFRVLSEDAESAFVHIYCMDLETNTIADKTITIPLARFTKADGLKQVEDPRDKYEIIANNAARRLRSCIWQVIPGDIRAAANKQCEETLRLGNPGKTLEDRQREMAVAFKDLGIPLDILEKRLGHKLTATSEAELVSYHKIFKSLKDGVARPEQFFDLGGPSSEELEKKIMDTERAQQAEKPKNKAPKKEPAPDLVLTNEEGPTPDEEGQSLKHALNAAFMELGETNTIKIGKQFGLRTISDVFQLPIEKQKEVLAAIAAL